MIHGIERTLAGQGMGQSQVGPSGSVDPILCSDPASGFRLGAGFGCFRLVTVA